MSSERLRSVSWASNLRRLRCWSVMNRCVRIMRILSHIMRGLSTQNQVFLPAGAQSRLSERRRQKGHTQRCWILTHSSNLSCASNAVFLKEEGNSLRVLYFVDHISHSVQVAQVTIRWVSILPCIRFLLMCLPPRLEVRLALGFGHCG